MDPGYASLMSNAPRMWTDVGLEVAATIRQHLLEKGVKRLQASDITSRGGSVCKV